MSFIPNLKAPTGKAIPFFEDSAKLEIPGRGTTKNIERLQSEIIKLMGELGAFNCYFQEGKYPGKPDRDGFQLHFQFANARGRIDIAGLPLRKPTFQKKVDSLKQALYLVRGKVEAMVWANVYEPGAMPLVPYMIGANGRTVTEELVAAGQLPMLKSGTA